jgi:peptidoglycan/LPS O-acetylase OafA/YrhL
VTDKPSPERYQPHIDGLRAIAVAGVILAHLKLIPVGHFAVPGGYTGVDVFFVISGFLISRIILNESATGTFSYLQFYARRARRILPALMFVMIATMLAGLLLLHPLEFEGLARSFVAALAFSPNIYFYQTANYFGPTAHDLPLLHLWSLGVEEQFYLVLPLFASLMLRLKRPALAVSATILASLTLAQFFLKLDPPAVFYLLPFRAFELLIGTMLALPGLRRTTKPIIAAIAGSTGILLIAWSYHYLGSPTSFPGARALPACIGAALVIWSGECAVTLPTQLLSTALATWIGKLSYSLYLVHWPILFFVTRAYPDNPHNGLAVLSLTIPAAIISYACIERPFRRLLLAGSKATLSLAAGSLASFASIGTAIVATGGLSWRVDDEIIRLTSFLKYTNAEQYRAGTCFLSSPGNVFADLKPQCLAKADKPILLLWGDSGAAHYASQIARAAADKGYEFRQATASACPPAIDIDISNRPNCRHFNAETLRQAIAIRPAMILLSAAWPTELAIYPQVGLTIDRLQEAKLDVIVLGPGPAYRAAIPTVLADRYRINNPEKISGDELVLDWINIIDRTLMDVVDKRSPARYVSIFRTVCPAERCPLLAGDTPVHFDYFHVTEKGAELFVKMLGEQIFSTSSYRRATSVDATVSTFGRRE